MEYKVVTKDDLIEGILKMVAMREISVQMALMQIQRYAEDERIKWAN